MRSLLCGTAVLASLAVLAGAPAPAAPTPVGGPRPAPLEKYLPDDTDALLVVNVRQVLASPMAKKGLDKQVAALINHPAAQSYLKDAGFDPLKDIDRVIVCAGRSCWSDDENGREDGPFVLFQGRFDVAKARAKMAQLAADKKGTVHAFPDGKAYLLDEDGPYIAPLDSGNLLITGRKALVAEALAKAAGKRTTKLAKRQTIAEIKKLKADVAVQAFVLESTIVHSSRSTFKDAKGGKAVFRVKHTTLGEEGFKSIHLTINVKDDARGSVALTVKGPALFKAKADEFTEGLAEVRRALSRQAMREPKLAPIARFLDGVMLSTGGQTITLQGVVDYDTAKALLAEFVASVR
jgi:hypothetical protein